MKQGSGRHALTRSAYPTGPATEPGDHKCALHQLASDERRMRPSRLVVVMCPWGLRAFGRQPVGLIFDWTGLVSTWHRSAGRIEAQASHSASWSSWQTSEKARMINSCIQEASQNVKYEHSRSIGLRLTRSKLGCAVSVGLQRHSEVVSASEFDATMISSRLLCLPKTNKLHPIIEISTYLRCAK